MKLVHLFVKGLDEAVINNELISLNFKPGFVVIKYREQKRVYLEYHNIDNVQQISVYEEKRR